MAVVSFPQVSLSAPSLGAAAVAVALAEVAAQAFA